MPESLKIRSSVFITIVISEFIFHHPLAHVIGGGFNTDISVAPFDGNTWWPKTALSTVRSSRNKRTMKDITILKRNADYVIDTANGPAMTLRLKHGEPELSIQSSPTSDAESGNPFLRVKLSEKPCQFPESIAESIRDLSSGMSGSHFVGLYTQLTAYTFVPDNQPVERCPSAAGSWWGERTDFNLLSTCPWVYTKKSLGEDFFPRYLSEAKCLCRDCITADAYGCEELKHNVTVFQRQGCKEGIAMVSMVKVPIVVGCYCAAPPKKTSADMPFYTRSH